MEDTDEVVPLFVEDGTIEAAVNRAMEVLRPMQRGQLCLWAVLEWAAGFGRESPHWSAFQHRLRRDYLRETGVAMWAKKTVGLKLLTYEEQVRWRSVKRRKKAARQLHKDMVELMAIPDDELPLELRNERSVRVRRAREQMLNVRRSNKIADGFGNEHQSVMPRPRKR